MIGSGKLRASRLEEEQRKASQKASWESRNEGVHERINFDDTIWGFNLAGGVYYHTPLRVTSVKQDSRAQNAGIRPGDVMRRINDVDTSTLTVQQAHDMILESGIHIRLAVSAPDDEGTTYNVWQDHYEDEVEEERQKIETKTKKIHKEFKGAKTNSDWSLMWPWTSKRAISYRESNCFLVPSRYEAKHPDDMLPAAKNEKTVTMQPKSSQDVEEISNL